MAEQQKDIVSRVFDSALEVAGNYATSILTQKTASSIAKDEIESQLRVQQYYDQLSRQSPNLSSNDPNKAAVAAAEQTAVMQNRSLSIGGLDMNWLTVAVVVILVAVVFFKRKG